MGFFESFFNTVGTGNEEVAVLCPFPHYTSSGIEYLETNPSAHVNIGKRAFHCKACDQGYNELSFITKVLNCSYGNALRLSKVFNNTETVDEWSYTPISPEAIQMCKDLGISEEVIKELRLGSITEGAIMFPVFLYDHLVDIRTYIPEGKPKIKSRTGSASGLIIPQWLWDDTPLNRTTLVCAGEKDMAVARSHGFNAITITGGEMALPLSTTGFQGRDIAIVYDNDASGKVGAVKLASHLLEHCRSVKVCTGFHEVCKEDKEDITDFFTKYDGTRELLIEYLNNTPLFTPEDTVKNSPLPLISLEEATTPEYLGKMVRSNIQTVAISELQYVTPSVITGEKLRNTDKGDQMYVGEIKEWDFTEQTAQDILHLIDNNFTEDTINKNMKKLLRISPLEKYVKLSKMNRLVVFKAYITDMFESMNTDTMPMEYTAYCIGVRLESGKKYMATYKLVPHPYKGQQLIMIITNAVQASDSVSNFTLTTENIANLSVVQSLAGTVKERMNTLAQKVKGLLGYNGNDTLIKCIDLAYHTVLSFNLGTFEDVRGYLDTLIVGESRMGKSSTAETLRKTYQLGTFTSLAGNSATVAGLIGGSNKVAGGGYQTKAGIIPQNHKGLIIFEEFGKCNSNIVAELTDIRSSNEVRITRVSGTLNLPAMVRMISLSNVKAHNGEIKSIASYPNGISIVTELVTTAEDIARYDLLVVLGDKGTTQIDPYWAPEEPLSEEVYQTRIRWVWSRTPDQVIIDEEVGKYIITKANELNKTYNSHIKIFGTEGWKKLSRLAIAVAGYLVSTDSTYEKLIVKEEHVEYAANLFVELYDNPTFRLKEYVTTERKYNTIDEDGVSLLEKLYIKVPQLLIMLEQEAKPSRNTLMAAVGLDANTYNGFMSQLIRGSFIKLNGSDVLPTERFRLGMQKINRNSSLRRLGET